MAHVQPQSHFVPSFSRSYPPPATFSTGFDFVSADEPTRVTDPEAPTHVLLRQTTLEPGAFERSDLEQVEVMGSWGSTVLFARHLTADARGFSIGESSATEAVDFELAAEMLGASSSKIVDVQGGLPHVLIPAAARATMKRGFDACFMPCVGSSIALEPGTVVELELGKLKFRIANVAAGQSTPRAGLASMERPVLAAFGLSFASVAALVGAFAFWMPSLGLTDDEGLDQDRLTLMQQYLHASAERSLEEQAANDQSGNKDNQPGSPAEAAAGREGAMGKVNAPVTNKRAAARGDAEPVAATRAQQIKDAQTFGMIELLGTLSSAGGAGSPFLANTPGGDAFDAEGNMWGDQPGESGGFGGLRLTGMDNGGGGKGAAIALGGNGTCLGGNCGPRGFGSDRGLSKGEHVARAPRITPTGRTNVSGHIPPEVVQRIVRQNYGRFRMCYENGLRSNPNLTGRVTARFVISREGAVSNVQNGGSDLPDAGVVGCVIQAFYGLSFPAPDAGIVTVSYPIMLSPG